MTDNNWLLRAFCEAVKDAPSLRIGEFGEYITDTNAVRVFLYELIVEIKSNIQEGK